MTDTGKVSELVARLRKQQKLKTLLGETSLSGKPLTLDSEAADALEALAARLRECEKDAGRYRWLREGRMEREPELWVARGHPATGLSEWRKGPLDELIDAASAAMGEDERYDCPIHGLQDGPDCPRC